MQRDNTTPGGKRYIYGAIDSVEEARLLANFLWTDPSYQHLLNRLPENQELDLYLAELRTERISGPVDTPREMRIFIKFLERNGFLKGPADTIAEQQLINKLKQKGLFVDFDDTFAPGPPIRPRIQSKPKPSPKSKKRHRPDEDDEAEEPGPDNKRPSI